MKLSEYQEKAMQTRLPTAGLEYMWFNLPGEVGELTSLMAKAYRDGGDTITLEEKIKKELGDILWTLTGLISCYQWKLEDIAQMNLDKLAKRKEDNTLQGSGDDR